MGVEEGISINSVCFIQMRSFSSVICLGHLKIYLGFSWSLLSPYSAIDSFAYLLVHAVGRHHSDIQLLELSPLRPAQGNEEVGILSPRPSLVVSPWAEVTL